MVLRRIGGASLTPGVVGRTFQDTTTEGEDNENEEVSETVEQLLKVGKPFKAEQLLKESEITFGSRQYVRPTADVLLPDLVQPDEYEKAKSHFHFQVWKHSMNDEGKEIYKAFLGFSHQGDETSRREDSSSVPDGLGFSFSDDKWEYEGRSFEGSDVDGQGTVHNPDPQVEGIKAEYSSPDLRPGERIRGWMLSSLEKQERGEHNVFAHYSHTWKPFRIPGNVSFGIGYGIFSVSVSGGVEYWKTDADELEVKEV